MNSNYFCLFIAFLALNLASTAPLPAFLVINQTDTDRLIRVQEAYRPEADSSGNKEFPLALNHSPEKVRVRAKSMEVIELTPCKVILVSVIEKTRTRGFWSSTTSSSTSVRCYEPYEVNGQGAEEITDDWGLVIHDPEAADWRSHTRPDQDYGIKLVHPDYIELFDSMDELPWELQYAQRTRLQRLWPHSTALKTVSL